MAPMSWTTRLTSRARIVGMGSRCGLAMGELTATPHIESQTRRDPDATRQTTPQHPNIINQARLRSALRAMADSGAGGFVGSDRLTL